MSGSEKEEELAREAVRVLKPAYKTMSRLEMEDGEDYQLQQAISTTISLTTKVPATAHVYEQL